MEGQFYIWRELKALRLLFLKWGLCYFKDKMNLKELEDEKILILGFGREGRDTFRFLRKLFPKKILAVAVRLEFKK